MTFAPFPRSPQHFTGFTQQQKNWWVTEEASLGGDMKREYPATPKEAFEQAIEGSIFGDDIASAYKHGRIGAFPIDTSRPVHTFWDLGHADETAIWFAQDYGAQTRFVGYYENSGEFIDFYIRYLDKLGQLSTTSSTASTMCRMTATGRAFG
jgi:hypothetical protein